MPLSIPVLAGWLVASPGASELPSHGLSPLDDPSGEVQETLPVDGVEPLGRGSRGQGLGSGSGLPIDGVAPLEEPGGSALSSEGSALPSEGVAPLPSVPVVPPRPLDPSATTMARIDAMVGMVGRIRPVDAILSVGVEVGRMQGLSGSFHTELIVVTDRVGVEALDFPVGAGALWRAKLGQRPLFGSVGLTAGILVHRARTDQGVIRRVDPDFRLPLRMAWTAGRSVGVSVAFVPGYSVRERSYERRGARVWNRHSVRLGLVVGLHWDIVAGRTSVRRPRDANGQRGQAKKR